MCLSSFIIDPQINRCDVNNEKQFFHQKSFPLNKPPFTVDFQ